MNNLTQAHAVVVGGASGIGAGICRALVERGVTVDLVDLDLQGAEAMAVYLTAIGGDVLAHAASVTDEASLARVQSTIRAYRGRVDLLFANAGVIAIKPFLETTIEDWRWLFEINCFGTVNTVRAFLPALLTQGGSSRISVTSSISMLRSADFIGQTIYVSSKAAQHGFLAALEGELKGTNVSLCTILPGPVSSSLRAKSEASRPGAVAVPVPGNAAAGIMSGDEAGRIIVEGVMAGRRYVTTHPAEGPRVALRAEEIRQAFTV